MQNVIGFYGYLVCCIDFEREGEQLQEKEPYLSVNVIYNVLLYLYMDQHCVFTKIIIQRKPSLCFYCH